MAGLLAARVLADHFDQVTIVERDHLPQGAQFRAGVPQSRHVHALLARGAELLERLFPGLEADVRAAGAHCLQWPRDVMWLLPAGWCTRFDSGIKVLSCSRGLLEWSVRRRLACRDTVSFLDASEVTGLVPCPGGGAVAGVQLRSRRGGSGAAAPVATLPASLVVDASGRDSQAPRWLAALGYPAPRETRIDALAGYASRCYARPSHHRGDWKALFLQARPPTSTRLGLIFPIEGDRWLVSLQGMGSDYPPTGEAGFLEFARGLRSPLLYDAIKDAEPLSPIHGYRSIANQWRHYEGLRRQPESFVVLGDAACAFNPIYGQGMATAALAAAALQRSLEEQRLRQRDGSLTGLASRCQQRVARGCSAAWLLATSEDLRYPTTRGARPDLTTRLLHRYLNRVIEAATVHPAVNRAFLDVVNLISPPTSLFRPSVLLPALAGAGSPPRDRLPIAPRLLSQPDTPD
jgi:2-polyprenyl-6-methoxyphenol hydroxylase-like FAD-dependent oxidoreductase